MEKENLEKKMYSSFGDSLRLDMMNATLSTFDFSIFSERSTATNIYPMVNE